MSRQCDSNQTNVNQTNLYAFKKELYLNAEFPVGVLPIVTGTRLAQVAASGALGRDEISPAPGGPRFARYWGLLIFGVARGDALPRWERRKIIGIAAIFRQ